MPPQSKRVPVKGDDDDDHDELDSVALPDTNTEISHDDNDDERDEVKEIKKITRKDTNTVRVWRILVTCLLLATGAAVVAVSYSFLTREEDYKFKQAVSSIIYPLYFLCDCIIPSTHFHITLSVLQFGQFSKMVADASLGHQVRIREATKTLAITMSRTAQVMNATWPFFALPHFATFGENEMEAKKLETLQVMNIVYPEDYDDYIEYTRANAYEWIYESHMRRYGNMDNFVPEPGLPPYLKKFSFTTGLSISTGQDIYFPWWTLYPPPGTYNAINWDFGNSAIIMPILQAVVSLKNEPLVSQAGRYGAVEKTEEIRHQKYHAELKNSSISHPHSFMFTPVQKDVDDPESPVVALISSNIAWDRALTNLLPDDVQGILMVGRNNCNQSFTYDIQGSSAIFLGMGDLHDPTYDSMEVVVDVAIHTNPLYKTTPNHCMYELVRCIASLCARNIHTGLSLSSYMCTCRFHSHTLYFIVCTEHLSKQDIRGCIPL
jgi:hypothetical protein